MLCLFTDMHYWCVWFILTSAIFRKLFSLLWWHDTVSLSVEKREKWPPHGLISPRWGLPQSCLFSSTAELFTQLNERVIFWIEKLTSEHSAGRQQGGNVFTNPHLTHTKCHSAALEAYDSQGFIQNKLNCWIFGVFLCATTPNLCLTIITGSTQDPVLWQDVGYLV